MVAAVDLLILNAAQLVTPAGQGGVLSGAAQGLLEVIPDGAVAIAGGRVVAAGPTQRVLASVGEGAHTRRVDARGMVLTPGLVDAHTHVVHAGQRLDDFERRARGETYAQILAAGGGIHSTVAATRAADEVTLLRETSRRLDRMLRAGTTTAESKSGYGLDLQTELRQLAVMGRIDHPVSLVPTFLGAHAIAPGQDGDRYLDFVIDDVLPAVVQQGIARFCDIFCERGVFTPAQSERLLLAATRLGLLPKVHADELADTGGAALAARVGAISADHLHCASEEGLAQMAAAGTVAVLLPGTGLFLGMADHAPARRMVELGVPIALGTDLNPGSCPSDSQALMMSLAVTQLRLSPAEAMVAATANAASACGLGDTHGRLAPGFVGDVVLWDAEDYRAIAYHQGANLVAAVFKGGRSVVEGHGTLNR